MENKERIEKAESLKALIDKTKPVIEWGFASAVWCNLKGDIRVYVNDKKRKAAAVFAIDADGKVKAEWQTGHSLTRNELKAAIPEVR
jgi:hypothetical protein